MGVDETVTGQSQSRGARGQVVELLPAAAYRVRLEDEALVTAHAAGAAEKNFVRLRPGDRVRVVLSARDRSRGRIVELLERLS